MFRTLIQLAMITAGAGLLTSQLDQQTLQKIESALRELGSTFRQSGLPGDKEAAAGMEKAADAVRSASSAQASANQENGVPVWGQETHPKAFYNKLDEECHWEKVIDPSTGRVSCSVPGQRQKVR